MGKWLNEHQVGFDTNHIGFPELGDCMAVVLHGTQGLFGFHITPGNAKQSGEFARFINSKIGLGNNWSCLYGSCNRARRCGGSLAQWKTEMESIAEAIDYTGTIKGFDISKDKSKITTKETAYLEYRMDGTNQCSIYFKRMSKMAETGTFGAVDPDVKIIRRDAAKTTDVWDPVFALRDNTTGRLTSGVSLAKTTRGNKGELHLVKATYIDSFDYAG